MGCTAVEGHFYIPCTNVNFDILPVLTKLCHEQNKIAPGQASGEYGNIFPDGRNHCVFGEACKYQKYLVLLWSEIHDSFDYHF